MSNCGSGEKEENSRVVFPHLPEQQKLPTRFNSLWAAVRHIKEVLQRVEAFLCEMQRTALKHFNAS